LPERDCNESHSITPQTCIVRDTASQHGRTLAIAPGATAASRHLHYGRVILRPGDSPIRIDTGDRETGFVGLKGSATATVDGATYTIDRYDALYVPRDASVTIAPGASGCDLAEIAAPVSKRHPVQHVRFADVQANPGLHFNAGGPRRSAT
jgi:5-deoxy-D-glucuronate isomerase